jgi:hypothetical protein
MSEDHRGVNEMENRQALLRGKRGSRLSTGMSATAMTIALVGVSALGTTAALGTAATSADRAGGGRVTAHAARTIWVHEVVHGTNVSHQGVALVHDRGYERGTYSCAADIYIRIYYTKGSIKIVCKANSGSIEAMGKVAFFSAGATATFTGTIPITHGTGKYVHGSGHYRVEGTVVRKTFAAEASTSGWFTY